MGFGIADLSTIVVLKRGLERLAANPDHVNFMLSGFTGRSELLALVGAKHVDQCVQFITERRLHIAPYYAADLQKLPSLVVAHKPTEGQQFIGDYGSDVHAHTLELPPTVMIGFDAVGFVDNAILVPVDLHMEDKVWRNLWIVNGNFRSKVDGVLVGDTTTQILLKDNIPAGTAFRGWSAQTSAINKQYEVHASIDNTEVQIKLTTAGEYEVHRLMAVAVRYVLKQGRLHFDELGLQVATFSQSFPMLTDPEQLVYETSFGISCKVTDSWIDHEYVLPDPAGRTDFETIATQEGEQDVVVGE